VINRSSPSQIGTLTTWSSVAAGGTHSSVVNSTNILSLWGTNGYGQLGQNDATARSSPTQIGIPASGPWAEVAAARSISAAIDTSGRLWAWGLGTTGQLGNNAALSVSSPTQVGTLSAWSKVALGISHAVAIKTDGTLWGWGLGTSGQLGNNSAVTVSSPTQVGTRSTWVQIAAGYTHSMAVDSAGMVWAWGLGTSGQLGTNATLSTSSPVVVGSAVTTDGSIAAGVSHSMAIFDLS
jgi:alpha-tubulin suppressor-like RCC1 family protein